MRLIESAGGVLELERTTLQTLRVREIYLSVTLNLGNDCLVIGSSLDELKADHSI